ncbi:hypothetical protein SAMN03159414_0873 [Pseudomonas sp. NFACC41-3]|nr:hypothetical protein SAMN03159414_0873 [Pseudomonas sp. NFACC41-3]
MVSATSQEMICRSQLAGDTGTAASQAHRYREHARSYKDASGSGKLPGNPE